tara:strand:+ start:983 stop:1594 length:612 start_codon:yes stop_codon:yes gene_type:complete
MPKIILIGSGGHARSCIDVIEKSGKYKIAGLIEKKDNRKKENLSYKIIGTDDDLVNLRKKFSYAIITIGQITSAETRVRLYKKLKRLKFELPTIISPKAYVSSYAKIGDGTIIFHNSIVNANSKIGNNCIINNKALIEHDVTIGDNTHIATGAIINGDVSIGSKTFIGSGVITKQSVIIGDDCVIGAGVVVRKNILSNQFIKH